MSVSVGFKQPLKGEDKTAPVSAEERKQKQIDALAQRATFEFRRGQFERARMLGKYLHDVERAPEGTKILAIASHQLGDEDAAWLHYPAALEAYPADLNVIVGFAELCLNRIELTRARELLERALELDPEARHPSGAKARLLILRAEKNGK
jgi:Tfp pilus assembly protein PilF